MSASSTPSSGTATSAPSATLVIAAFAAIYVIWGSTYLGIRFAIESMPPLFMGAVRFLIAGGLLHLWCMARAADRPSASQWRAAAIAGTLMLGGGNGAVVVAEQWVPSGMVALLVACVPLWMVIFDRFFGSKTRPSPRAMLGLLVGFVGVALLGGAPGVGEGGPQEMFGALLVLAGSASWAAGSVYLKEVAPPRSQLLWVSMQMLMGGLSLALLSVAVGEPADVRLGEVTTKSALALAYLIVFGALIAYSAYIWLLRVTTPARVGTYAYVNPVIALVLGWALADEPISLRSVFAGAIILAGVVTIVSESRSLGLRGVRVRKAGE